MILILEGTQRGGKTGFPYLPGGPVSRLKLDSCGCCATKVRRPGSDGKTCLKSGGLHREMRMKRTMLLCGLLAGAALAAGAQQSNANDPYQGVSTPPPDDEITTTAPARKPDAGRPLVVPPTPTAPVAVPQPTPVPEPLPVRRSQTPAPEQASSAVLQPEAERNYTHSSDPDADIVHPVEVKTVPVKPGLSWRASAS